MLKALLFFCHLLLIISCQQPSPVTILNNLESQEVIGGQIVTSNHFAGQSTVGIYVPTSDDQVALVCTGLLTFGNRIITAAHCLTQFAKALKISDFELADYLLIGFGLPVAKKLDSVHNEFSRIKRAHIHPEFNRNIISSHADIALIDLLDPAPDTTYPAEIGNFDQWFQKSPLFDVYGLGNRAFIINFSSNEMRKVTLQMKPNNTITFDSHSTWTTGLCDGDSGAPVFVINPTRNIAVGITSMAGIGCVGEMSFVKLYPFIDWIKQDLSH